MYVGKCIQIELDGVGISKLWGCGEWVGNFQSAKVCW